jgi:hypothetical protein
MVSKKFIIMVATLIKPKEAIHGCLNDYLCCNNKGKTLTECHWCPEKCTGNPFSTDCNNPDEAGCPVNISLYGKTFFSCTLGSPATFTPSSHSFTIGSGNHPLGTSITTYYNSASNDP